MKNLIIILVLIFNITKGQCKYTLYEKAISYINKDFIDNGIQNYYNNILSPNAYGISIYEKTYPIYKTDNYRNWLNIDKTITGNKKDECLIKLNKLYWKKNWKTSKYYKNSKVFTKEKFKGPSHIAIFTTLRNDSLRIDVISNSKEGVKYCGSVNKYLLIFDKNKSIIDVKKWKSHYECL